VGKKSWLTLEYYLGIYLKRLIETMIKVSQDRRCPAETRTRYPPPRIKVIRVTVPSVGMTYKYVDMKFPDFFFHDLKRMLCDVIIVKTCLCMFHLAPIMISTYKRQ